MPFLVKKTDGSCGPYAPAGIGPASEYVMLREGVGRGARNLAAEVLATQKALNKIPGDKGGAVRRLWENGTADGELFAAILRFKSINVPEDPSPILKYPMRATLVLNELLLASKQLVQTNAEILPKLRSLIGEAEACVKAARMNLDLAQDALQGITLPGVTAADRLRLLNRHFRIDLMPNKGQAIDFIGLTFARMSEVFQRPGNLWGSFVLDFDPSPPSLGWLAFTQPGGFFRNGEVGEGRRCDSIYLCELMRLATRDAAVQTIVHELAHFCGPKNGEIIGDHAYGLPETGKMKVLTPYQRLHNAENYGNYAWECKTGRDPAGMV